MIPRARRFGKLLIFFLSPSASSILLLFLRVVVSKKCVTGQEEEKQAVALEFAEVIKKERPGIRCITLPETLNALNQAGLAEDYKRMVADYRDTGIFNKDTLRKVGEAAKTKYLVQLKLMNFSQELRRSV
jgi:hypothetical protein